MLDVILGPGSSEEIEQLCDGDEQALLPGEPVKEAFEPGVNSCSLAEALCEVGVHDAYTPLSFQTILAWFIYPFTKADTIGTFRTREPKVHERLGRIIVGQGRVDTRNVDLVDGEVADILDVLFADIAPKIRRTFNMPLIQAASLKEGPCPAGGPPSGARQPASAPVNVIAIAIVVCMGARVVAQTITEYLQSTLNHVTSRIMVPDTMQCNFEALILEPPDELEILAVVQRRPGRPAASVGCY